MSVQDLLDNLAAYPIWIMGFMLLPPLLSWILVDYADNTRPRYWLDYVLSVLVYIVGVPGVVSAVLVGYGLFFIRQNLLEVNALLYFLPIVSMAATFALIGRKVDFDRLPGFQRLSGLMMLIALTFVVVLLVFKLRIFVGFFASAEALLGLGLILFLAFQFAAARLFK